MQNHIYIRTISFIYSQILQGLSSHNSHSQFPRVVRKHFFTFLFPGCLKLVSWKLPLSNSLDAERREGLLNPALKKYTPVNEFKAESEVEMCVNRFRVIGARYIETICLFRPDAMPLSPNVGLDLDGWHCETATCTAALFYCIRCNCTFNARNLLYMN